MWKRLESERVRLGEGPLVGLVTVGAVEGTSLP